MKNLLDGRAFRRLDQVIQVMKTPVQPAGQFLPDCGFPRAHKTDQGHSGHTTAGAFIALQSRLILAFLEVDFTTEGEQVYRGSSLAQGACEGTAHFGRKRSVLGFE
jgi:hypothetical protein